MRLKPTGASSAAATIKSSLTQQNEAGNRLSELGETLQQEKVVEAEAKVESFQKLKKEVGIAVCKAQLQVNEIRLKIREALFVEQGKPSGLLTQDEAHYFNCLEIKQGEFDGLLAKDEAYWLENLKTARQTLATYKTNL